MIGNCEQSFPTPLLSVDICDRKLLHPCWLPPFHTPVLRLLWSDFGPALPSILSHPVPIPPPSSHGCLPDRVFEPFPCTKTPSAQCTEMALAVGRLSQLGLDNPVSLFNHFLLRNHFISLISLVCVSFSIFRVGQSELHTIYKVEWSCFLFWFSPLISTVCGSRAVKP